MNKTITAVIVVAVIVVGGYFLLKLKNPGSQTPQGASPGETVPLPGSNNQIPAAPAASTDKHIVAYRDAGYSPATLRVKAGTTVTFKNEGSQAMWTASGVHPTHRLYDGTSLAEHCPNTAGTAFDACTGIQPGNSWSFTFTKKGTWRYHNHLSPGDTGTIVVE